MDASRGKRRTRNPNAAPSERGRPRPQHRSPVRGSRFAATARPKKIPNAAPSERGRPRPQHRSPVRGSRFAATARPKKIPPFYTGWLRVLLWRIPQIPPRPIFLPFCPLRSLRSLAAKFFDLPVLAAPRTSKNRPILPPNAEIPSGTAPKIANRKSEIKNTLIDSIEAIEALE
jgi:hypothetical protein